MSDLILMKRLSGACWLGLRMPRGLNVSYDVAKGLEVPATWGYADTVWPTNLQTVYLPSLTKAVDKPEPASAWEEVQSPNGVMPGPFVGITKALDALGEDVQNFVANTTDEPMKAMRDRFDALRANVSVPLRLMQIYREIGSVPFGTGKPAPKFLEEAMSVLVKTAGEKDLPIELFSGLLFLATCTGDPGPGEPTQELNCDPVDASTAQPVPLTIKAIQLPERVALQMSVAKGLLTNASVVNAIDPPGAGPVAAPSFSQTFRISRTLGIEQRPSLNTGHIAILREKPKSPGLTDVPDAPPGDYKAWEDRPFQPSDAVGQALVGELLNYQVSLFNAHGRRTHQGRLMVARQSLERPAPPTRGMARLIVSPKGLPQRMDIWLGLPETELTGTPPMLRATARPVFYRSDTPLIPTGFYGDADDAALATARVLSDLDPAALLASGMADFPAGDVPGVADPALASYGLRAFAVEPLAHFTQGRPDPDPSAWIYTPAVPADAAARKETDRLQWWTTATLSDAMDAMDVLIPENSGLRLYVALQRQVDATMLQPRQRAPESPLVPMALEIVVEGPVGVVSTEGVPQTVYKEAIVATVQHFERFWNVDLPYAALEEGLARVVGTEPEPAVAAVPGVPAEPAFPRLRVIVDHAAVVAPPKTPMAVGGYRLWMRDLAIPRSAFRMEAVVQALPPMVKTYAPIESGRLWSFPATVVDAPAVVRPDKFKLDRKIGFEGAVIDALNGIPLDKQFGASVTDALKAPGSEMLLIMRSLAMAGFACEVLLSVSFLNQLERSGSGAVPPAGNWLFMRDQNGRYLGRAWSYWGALAVEKLKRCYEITEEPNAQDTVGVDDFGHVHWNWKGIKDEWRHEMEWVIEPLARHAPLVQRIGTSLDNALEVVDRYRKEGGTRAIDASVSDDRASNAPRDLTLPPPESPPNFDAALKHRIVVQRRKALGSDVKFSAVQNITAPEDRFVFSVFAPDSFRQSTHNSVIRTAQGVLTMAVDALERKFLWAEQFPMTPEMRKLIRFWCERLPVAAETDEKLSGVAAPPSTLPLTGEYGELIIDEPSCFSIGFQLLLYADDVQGQGITEISNVRRNATAVSGAENFLKDKPFEGDRPWLDLDKTLRIPLARLAWRYTGDARPALNKDTMGSDFPDELLAERRSLLRLPDPTAEATVYVRNGDRFAPVAIFRAPALADLDANSMAPMKICKCTWGSLWAIPDLNELVELAPHSSAKGNFTVVMGDETLAKDVLVAWRMGDQQLLLPVIEPD